MGFMNEKLWDILEKKVEKEDAAMRKEQQVGKDYLSAVKQIC